MTQLVSVTATGIAAAVAGRLPRTTAAEPADQPKEFVLWPSDRDPPILRKSPAANEQETVYDFVFPLMTLSQTCCRLAGERCG